MAEVTLMIGGRGHSVACRDGEEAQLERLGAMLDERWETAQRASAHLGGERAMLFVALMLADSLDEAGRQPSSSSGMDTTLLARLADRLEGIADALEQTPAKA